MMKKKTVIYQESRLPKIGVIVRRDSTLGGFLQENLRQVLGERVAMEECFLEEICGGQSAEADILLIPTAEWAVEVRPFLREHQHIIVLQRTIREKEALRLAALPQGTRVLVVNDCPETVAETIGLFCQLGITNIDMVPFVEGREYRDIKIAVTPGEGKWVPPYIPTVIDVGNRCIDLSTFHKIINRLGLEDGETEQRILEYAETIVTLDSGIKRQYRELFAKNMELETVLNLSREGLLLVDREGWVTRYNQSFRELFPQVDVGGKMKAEDLFSPGVFAQLCRGGVDGVIRDAHQTIMVAKHALSYLGEHAGDVFVLQADKYIRQLDNSLSRKLREQGLVARYHFPDIRTRSAAMRECCRLAEKIALSERTVMITGESGTGKELLAQSIHNASLRRNQPFVAVNCAAVPDNLLESELFGYEGGAFTGALKEGKPGLFEQAHNGTIFLDEIGDMPLQVQAKLLRVLQERQVMRVGSQRIIDVNTRVIAATNQDLACKMEAGQFRQDLFYRLHVLPLIVPPLRDRTDDVTELLQHFLHQEGLKDIDMEEQVEQVLLEYSWPGNVRELQNVAVYLAFMVEKGKKITMEHLPQYLQGLKEQAAQASLDYGVEKEILASHCNWEKTKAVLCALEERTRDGKRGGRYYLKEYFAATGKGMGEGELKGILFQLKELELAEARSGSGSMLTEKGRQMVKWMEKQER